MALALRLSGHARPTYSAHGPRTGAAAIIRLAYVQSPSVATFSRHETYSPRRAPLGRRAASTGTTPSSRSIHSSPKRDSSAENLALGPSMLPTPPEPRPETAKAAAPLSVLPLTNVLRSLATTTISSSPLLLPPSLSIMSVLAYTTNPLLNPDRNPLLRYFLKKTFYAQFCAGENGREVRHTIDSLKRIGFSGVILGYGKEIVLTEEQTQNLTACNEGPIAEECLRNEIRPWANGNMETIGLASPGDFVALKFTGAGRQALYNLAERLAPSEEMGKEIDRICKFAAEKGVRLLFDAEQQAVQAGIDDWTLVYMRKYNTPERAVVYGTYQAYLKATPRILSEHLAIAKQQGFALGVKLVRGAYLGTDPRHLIHDTKANTDAAYDGIVAGLLKRTWSAPLVAPAGQDKTFPAVNMVVASHNIDTVRKARAILDGGARGTEVAFAQLQGMADEVSCELVSARKAPNANAAASVAGGDTTFRPRPYKYLVWGTTHECMKYLLRRAHENRDALQRTKMGRDAMRSEVARRVKALFGRA